MPKYGYIDQLIDELDAHADKTGSLEMRLSLEALKLVHQIETADRVAEGTRQEHYSQPPSLPH